MANEVDILVFSPHPDDAELGCGGSLILAAESGRSVAIVDMTEGERSSRGEADKRKNEKKTATRLLGIAERVSLGLPDTEIGREQSHRLAVIGVIRTMRPRMVLAPYRRDRHPDHAAAGKLVKEAVFYSGVGTMGDGFPYRPERVFYYMIHEPFSPSFVMDITSVWDRKMKVIQAYGSQLQNKGIGVETAISRPEFMRAVEARSVCFGAMIGAAYGEPFLISGPVPLTEFPGMRSWKGKRRNLPAYSMFL
ncbi:MAG: bacillithiol biosynthesis deacetylase BshB1 [Deltaproteobacteria bacterium]|nr:bacillithiol biosynthesis deacetylase BshB1 [Deltaproteobacteria bacterium]